MEHTENNHIVEHTNDFLSYLKDLSSQLGGNNLTSEIGNFRIEKGTFQVFPFSNEIFTIDNSKNSEAILKKYWLRLEEHREWFKLASMIDFKYITSMKIAYIQGLISPFPDGGGFAHHSGNYYEVHFQFIK